MTSANHPTLNWQAFCESRRWPFVFARGIVVSIVFGCGLAAWGALASRPGSEFPVLEEVAVPVSTLAEVPNAGLVMDKEDLNVSLQWERDEIELELTVLNPTDADVHIVRWRGMCGGVIGPHDVVIPAGESFDFTAWIQLTPRNPSSTRVWLDLGQTFRPIIAGHPGDHPGWSVRGTSLRAFAFPSHSVDWQYAETETGYRRLVTIPVVPLRPIDSFTATCDEEWAIAHVEGPDRSGHYLVTVTFEESHNLPPEQCHVRLSAEVRGGGNPEVSVRIPVR